MGDLVEARLDLLRELAELRPFLAELGRVVRRRQFLGGGPLDVVHDVGTVLAAMQADRHESRLFGHETGALGHQREHVILLAGGSLTVVICVTIPLSWRISGMIRPPDGNPPDGNPPDGNWQTDNAFADSRFRRDHRRCGASSGAGRIITAAQAAPASASAAASHITMRMPSASACRINDSANARSASGSPGGPLPDTKLPRAAASACAASADSGRVASS